MPVIQPAGVTAQGNLSLVFVTAIANPAAPTATEINAAAAVDGSCFLIEGAWAPAADKAKGSAPRRICSKKTYEKFGSTTDTLGDLQYVFAPQALGTANENKLYTLLAEGWVGFVVERLGKDALTAAFAAGDKVNVYPVEVGPQVGSGDTSDEFAEFLVTQSVIVRIPGVQRNVAVAA